MERDMSEETRSDTTVVEAEIGRIPKTLESFVTHLRPTPTLEALSVVFLHWAARCALVNHVGVVDFKAGAAAAWDCAVHDLAAAAPSFLARQGRQS
jgi:hypothetical protein